VVRAALKMVQSRYLKIAVLKHPAASSHYENPDLTIDHPHKFSTGA
jgi:hypothetical protein